MKLRVTLGFILLSIFSLEYAVTPANHIPDKGVLKLSNSVMDEGSLYNLNGEWEFYWKKLLTPHSYLSEKATGESIIVRVPSYWTNYDIEGHELTGMGYGTYALTLILPKDYRSKICIDMPVFDVAYKFYINNMLLGENGTVGTSRDTEKPWYDPCYYCFLPDSDTLQLLIQVSNFHHRRGGFWKPVFIGGSTAIINRAENRNMVSSAAMAILFSFIVFFVIFWFFSRQNALMLLFALSAMGIFIRLIHTGQFIANHILDTPWAWQIRMEYFGTYMASLFGIAFLNLLFPRKYMKPVITGAIIISSLLIISVLTLPPRLFAYGMFIFQPLTLIFLAHYLILSIIGTLRGRLKDAIFLFSITLFIFTLVNDIIVANSGKTVSTTYLTEISFQLFILSMAGLVILQWVNNNNERLRLESSLSFKNKVLSVIAHDLKNPVASVAQFVDLLTSKPELAGKKEILTSLHESSQAAVTLLDNLLYWGRSQAEELKVSPVELNLETLLEDVKSLYTHMALQKDVALSSSVPSDTLVFADKALVNIILRNLVSNAIKFTPSKGSVSIRAWTEGEIVHISISDTGIGIKPEIMAQFRNEGQLTSSPGTDKEIGTGLGLQLVSDLVAESNGILEVNSTPNKGSIFSFTLPVRKTKTNNENI